MIHLLIKADTTGSQLFHQHVLCSFSPVIVLPCFVSRSDAEVRARPVLITRMDNQAPPAAHRFTLRVSSSALFKLERGHEQEPELLSN